MNWFFASTSRYPIHRYTPAQLFTFRSYEILKTETDPVIHVENLDSENIELQLRDNNYENILDYYKKIKDEINKEFPNLNKFDALSFHTSTENMVTISKVPRENIRTNSVISVKYLD